MPGNFYSEPLKDEVKRLRAELSEERALCADLADANRGLLKPSDPMKPHEYEPKVQNARRALSELEKQA